MREALEQLLARIPAPVIAVSGGVDSLTLAAAAARVSDDVMVAHAVSPAVPAEATARVQRLAREFNWNLALIDAHEFQDPRYRANPVNRCFFCKSNLYGRIRAHTQRQILSGANLDDLGDYRPGLEAARRYEVRHPFVEARIDKRTVRAIARQLGLPDIADLPASPCLSSRVETGIRIESAALEFIHDVERVVAADLNPATVRCRIRANGVVIELDAAAFDELSEDRRARLTAMIAHHGSRPAALPISFEPYRMGSAFLVAVS
jgi:uncharacterized protein